MEKLEIELITKNNSCSHIKIYNKCVLFLMYFAYVLSFQYLQVILSLVPTHITK